MRVQVAIQTGTQLRSQSRRECPETYHQTSAGPVSPRIHVSARDDIGRLRSTGGTRRASSADAPWERRPRTRSVRSDGGSGRAWCFVLPLWPGVGTCRLVPLACMRDLWGCHRSGGTSPDTLSGVIFAAASRSESPPDLLFVMSRISVTWQGAVTHFFHSFPWHASRGGLAR